MDHENVLFWYWFITVRRKILVWSRILQRMQNKYFLHSASLTNTQISSIFNEIKSIKFQVKNWFYSFLYVCPANSIRDINAFFKKYLLSLFILTAITWTLYICNKNEPALGFAKVHTNHAKLLCEKVILTLTGLSRNKSLN